MLPLLFLTCGCLLAEPPTFQDQLTNTPGHQALDVPIELTEVAEATLPSSMAGASAVSRGATDAREDMGERLMRFTVGPRQRMTLRLVTSAGDSLRVQVGAANTNHPLQSALKAIGRLPPMLRAKKMAIPNDTDAPQRVLLKVSG